MRTKVLLCAAALAASLASSMAQNVYSLNVVGYVNVTLPSFSFTCVANPLDATLGGTQPGYNDITNLFQGVNGGSFIQTFNSGLNDYDNTSPNYSGRSSTWSSQLTMPPGLGVMYYNGGASDTVVTFVGQVEQGTYSVANLGAFAFAMVGSPVPIGGDLTNSTTYVGLAPAGGDLVQTFNNNPAVNDWNTAVSWSGRSSTWGGPMPVAPGQGFLYYSTTANAWTSNFTVQ